jgi:hypothetical protein
VSINNLGLIWQFGFVSKTPLLPRTEYKADASYKLGLVSLFGENERLTRKVLSLFPLVLCLMIEELFVLIALS